MADGNFNRSPLATNSYQSGVRAGKASMRTMALRAFEVHLSTHFQNASEEEREAMTQAFKGLLS
ncbi:MAG: hypothetical protein IKT82_06770 [Bacteroidaceae bacterium]|nr:hypothetical protein [Bacteroidaceae bacterium]